MPANTRRMDEYAKEAVKLVALDRQLASAMTSALRASARTKKATQRTYRMLAFADALAEALEATKVERATPARSPRAA